MRVRAFDAKGKELLNMDLHQLIQDYLNLGDYRFMPQVVRVEFLPHYARNGDWRPVTKEND
jgi:hypothetical protein